MTKILLIDDDPDDQQLFKDALQKVRPQLHMQTAVHGQQALDLLNAMSGAQLPDLVFIDLNMPVMDGVTFLQHALLSDQIRHLCRGVFSTAPVLNQMKVAKHLGASFFFTKPNSFDALCHGLERVITYDYEKGDYLIVVEEVWQ